MISPIVICGFPGVGKTTLFNEAQAKGIKILDSDSSKFDKSLFPGNYITHIKQALADGYVVLCSTHKAVRDALAEQNIRFAVVCPLASDQKGEYLARYVNRGSPEAFVKLMDQKWDEFLDEVQTDFNPFTRYLLPAGMYLNVSALEAIAAINGIQQERPVLPDAGNDISITPLIP